MDNKKARERKLLDEVAQIYPTFPVGKIICDEKPDFLIEQGEKTIGIEIVDYIRGQNKGASAQRQNEVLQQKIMDKAKETFESRFDIPLSIHVFWNNRYLLKLSDIPKIANAISQIVENNIPVNIFDRIRLGRDELEETVLETICHSINITRVRNEKQKLWSLEGVDWTEVQSDEIQYLINQKNNKIKKYKERCATVWLIIVADGQNLSSNIYIPEGIKNEVYKSSFDIVLVYNRLNNQVLPLNIKGE